MPGCRVVHGRSARTRAVLRGRVERAVGRRDFPRHAACRFRNTWNPFDKKDPNVKGSYSGPANGPGAAYAFDGKEVGTGTIRIVESSAPRKVTMQLDMQKPIEGHNTVEFTLTPRGDATEVTWAMRGSSPYIAKLMGVFVNMDRMIGQHFETGLADLKSLAERA
ncbi:MAG: polyketide cyclase [Betaproteobacteria bacterium]|nr:MAG: polyketide cyclase [Betaproteobacteria bacterium]